MRIGFLMDPLDGVRVGHDSTFALMLEAQRRGHQVRELRQEWLWVAAGRACARMRTVRVEARAGAHFEVLQDRDAVLGELDVLFLRKDPPVDIEFLHATQVVELNREQRVVFLNDPAGLRDANEKLFALRFPDLCPPTLVSRDRERLRAFCEAVGGDAVVKPLDGFGGQGVLRLSRGDPNFGAVLDVATSGGAVAVMAQAYLSAVSEGDKRIILVDGEPAGAILRVPPQGELRANMAAGGKAVATQITLREREICRRLAPELRRRGLHLVGIDVIGGFLTEVNVTSPTGLCEIAALGGARVEEAVLDLAERRVQARRGEARAG